MIGYNIGYWVQVYSQYCRLAVALSSAAPFYPSPTKNMTQSQFCVINNYYITKVQTSPGSSDVSVYFFLSLICWVTLLFLQAEVDILTPALVIHPVTVGTHIRAGTVGWGGGGRNGHILDTGSSEGYGGGIGREHFPKPVWRVQILIYAGWFTMASPSLVNVMTSAV